jgi:sortase (surface protein transpeptidase)
MKYIKFALVIFPVLIAVIFLSKPKPEQNQSVAVTQPPSLAIVEAKSIPTAKPVPVSLEIKSIGLKAPLIKTGTGKSGELVVPGNPDIAGWYEKSANPTVITGHLDSKAGPGVFWNLRKLKSGDEIRILEDDGSIAIYKVERKQNYSQNAFPTQAVYSPTPQQSLRIITCHGKYNPVTKSYSDNLVIFATLSRVETQAVFAPM